MKIKNKKLFLIIILIALIFITMLVVSGVILVTNPWTPVKGTVNIPGLHQVVEIIRDTRGIAYIKAADQHDLMVAQGFVHAQDRLWQMEMFRQLGRGALSAFLGRQTLEIDIHFRTIGLARMAATAYSKLDAEARACLEDYTTGVNGYLGKYPGRLPLEYTLTGFKPSPWTPEDSLVISYIMAYNMGVNFWAEIFRNQLEQVCSREQLNQLMFDSDTPLKDFLHYTPPAQEAGNALNFNLPQEGYAFIKNFQMSWGSNNWVVHGSRTTTGKPFLANDTHLDPMLPSVWYENSLHTKDFEAAGFSIPGIPLIIFGHNEKIAWGITDLAQDCQDLYLEKVDNPANPQKYLFKGEYRDILRINEKIAVKNEAPLDLEILFTQHGPFVNKAFWLGNWEPVTFRWAAYEGGTVMNSLVMLNKAQNWQQFTKALACWDSINIHFVYADTEGNIGYQAAGVFPMRTVGHSGNYPVAGWNGDFEWQGYIPYEKLPRVFNPPAGFIATANNNLATDGSAWRLTHTFLPGFRSQRIEQLLSDDKRFSPEDMQQIIHDTYSPGAALIMPYLLATVPRDDRQQQALDCLARWDLRMEVDSAAAAIYGTWYTYLLRNTVSDELKDQAENYLGNLSSVRHVLFMADILKNPTSTWFDDQTTPEQEDRQAICAKSLEQTLVVLQKLMGNKMDKWRWGSIHHVTYTHQPLGKVISIFNKTCEAGGGVDTINNAIHYNRIPPFKVIYGTSQRLIINLADFAETLVINTTGQNGNWFHPHRTDQSGKFRDREWIKMAFTPPETGKQAGARLVLLTE